MSSSTPPTPSAPQTAAKAKVDVFAKRRETKIKTTAPYGDLLSLVSLQAVLAGTKEQLQEVQERCDRFIEEDIIGMLRREMSEREKQVESLREKTEELRARATSTSKGVERRRGLICRRGEMLQQARTLHERDQQALIDQQRKIEQEKQKRAALVASLGPIRTTLLQTLSTIFPIAPLEPKDLLFTIVNVPLPVPLSSSEPAPPFALPGQPSFNDETVASALGFVAQAVQLVSAYIGHPLTYPVTCVGSRSLIKDPISAMMGPRNFPLYIRGVDTYRFEYGVFLLNKNIEMLMGERNLRAIDLRHTLPNIHNLILTETKTASIPNLGGPTGDYKYYDHAVETYKAFQTHLLAPAGYAGIDDIRRTDSKKIDDCESFWYAEVLKYLYFTFDDPNRILLDDWVFNTEGHPFRAPPAKPIYSSGN